MTDHPDHPLLINVITTPAQDAAAAAYVRRVLDDPDGWQPKPFIHRRYDRPAPAPPDDQDGFDFEGIA